MSAVFTPDEVAIHFKTTRRLVIELARTGKWPHLRLNRNQIRFTEEHLKVIESSSEHGDQSKVTPLFDRIQRRSS